MDVEVLSIFQDGQAVLGSLPSPESTSTVSLQCFAALALLFSCGCSVQGPGCAELAAEVEGSRMWRMVNSICVTCMQRAAQS